MRGVPRAQSMAGHVVAAGGEPLVVPDVERDARFAGNPSLVQFGARFYAGVPLSDAQQQVLGTLCLIDSRPRQLSPRDLLLLQKLADEVLRLARAA